MTFDDDSSRFHLIEKSVSVLYTITFISIYISSEAYVYFRVDFSTFGMIFTRGKTSVESSGSV